MGASSKIHQFELQEINSVLLTLTEIKQLKLTKHVFSLTADTKNAKF